MRAFALAVVVVALIASGCGGSGGDGRLPLIVDTDLSSDDALALLYLAQDPDVALRAVTVSGTGLVHCPAGARIALDLLAVAGRPEVPVACGAERPLEGFNEVPADWRGAADGLFGLALPPARRDAEPDAVELLRSAIEDAPRPPTVVELAPMTNLASAFRAHPGLAERLERVVAMGGALDVPGNAPGEPRAETNAWLDPAAARAVLRSGAPVTVVPLDATNQVPVTTFLAQALARYHYATPAATAASEIVAATNMGAGGTYLWDPLAAVAATRPGLVRTAQRRIDVTADGRTTAGGTAVRVATAVDRAAFERELVGTLVAGAPFSIPPHRVRGTLTLDDRGCTYRGADRLTAGEVLIDTVNRTSAPLQFIAGRLAQEHTVRDLERFAETVTADTDAPPWFTADEAVWTPPHSDMTWRVRIETGTTGETVLACATTDPPRAWVVTSLPVFAAGR
jgi:pyrimidine-specific ribonucleoside hydrolase